MENTIAYLVMCGIGGFILLIEAHRQFSSPIQFHNQSGYRILDQIELEDLAARRIILRGYLFYLGMYLLVYILLLTVVQLGDMVLRVGENNGAEGPLSFENVDTFFLDREGVARPIYIVVGMIALLSTGWAQKIEHVMRSAAHRLAGVPSGIFRTITLLNRMDYTLPEAEQYLQRTQRYLKLHAQDPDVQENARHILTGLRKIDYVAEAVVTPLRDSVFAQQDIDALDALLTKQAENIRLLDAELNDPDADRIKLLSRIEEEKRNLHVLFSVLYFKDQSIEPAVTHPPCAHVLRQLGRKPRDYVQSGLMYGALALMVITLVLGFVLELFYAKAAGYGPIFGMPDTEYTYRASKALWAAMQSAFIFSCAGMVAALTRSKRLVEGDWKPYALSDVPVPRLLWVSLFSAAMATFIATVVLAAPNFIASVSGPGGADMSSVALKSLRGALGDSLRYGASMVIVAFTVLLIADQHNNLEARQTVSLAVVGTAIAALFMLMLEIADPGRTFGKALQEIGIFALAGMSFLVSYAIMVEKTEEQELALDA